MIGKGKFGQAFDLSPLHGRRVAVAAAFLLMLSLQSFDLRAELLFRNLERVSGQQAWSAARQYGNPSDTANYRVSAGGAAPAQEVRVILTGEITRKDVDSAAVMAGLVRSGKQKLAGNTVWLASNGGDVDAGMDLGRLLRKLGAYTFVGKDEQCMSACVFAFMGGERRGVAGRLGIHRPYFPSTLDVPDRQAHYRYLQKTLKNYIAEMDFPDSFYEAIMLVPPESLQIVSPADLKRFFLEGISPSTEDTVDAAAARRLQLSMYEYLRRKAKAPACTFAFGDQGPCERKVPEATASGPAADDGTGMQKGGTASTAAPREPAMESAQGSGTPRRAPHAAPGQS